MMDDPIVSVIIPVYKVERFLAECMDSVIGQDYPALEIILVDDGSPDSCPEMCDRYAEAYDYIKTIHKKNEGLGLARKTGMQVATGKYITFVDSDDCLDGSSAIRRMVERAEEKQADIVVGSYRRLNGRKLGRVRQPRLLDGVSTETVDFRFKGFVSPGSLVVVWGKLYRRDFLTDNGLKFRDYPFADDNGFSMMCCTCKPAYAFMDESVYLYRVNGDSLTSRYQENYYLYAWIAIASDLTQSLSVRGLQGEYDDLIAFHLCIGLALLASAGLKHIGMVETVKALSRYGKNPLVRKMARQMACGKYIGKIEQKVWRVMMWGASMLCSLNAYILLTLGVWALRKAADLFLGSAVEKTLDGC